LFPLGVLDLYFLFLFYRFLSTMLSAKFKSAVESVRVMALSSAQSSPLGDRESIFRGGDTLLGSSGGKWNLKAKQPGGMMTNFGFVKEEEVEKEERMEQSSPRNGLYRMIQFDSDSVCGCRVGGAGYVCAVSEVDCRVKSHKLKVIDLPLGDHYGLCKVTDSPKNAGTMLGDLFVPVEAVPQETMEDWESSPTTAENWSYPVGNISGCHSSQYSSKDSFGKRRLGGSCQGIA
jgi:hypothetical protein